MPGQDALADRADLGAQGTILRCQNLENAAGRRRDPAVGTIGNNLKQLTGPVATLGRYDAQFGEMPANGVAQHGALTHQQLSGPMQHQRSLLFSGLDCNEAHRWPRHRLADCRGIVRIVFAALQVGLHIARRHQLHCVTEGLQLASPVMGRRTSLDAYEALRQTREELQHLRPADTLADYHLTSVIDPVNLEYRLRNIDTNRANFAHGRLPSMWFALTQPPYGTSMPESGRRPQHQKRTCPVPPARSALPLTADIGYRGTILFSRLHEHTSWLPLPWPASPD